MYQSGTKLISNSSCQDVTYILVSYYAQKCPIGMESGDILSCQLAASSEQSPYHRVDQARLNNSPKSKNAGAWCPKEHDDHQWLQIDMGKVNNVLQIATQVLL